MGHKTIAFSGVQPSGTPSIGNYLGAFRPFTRFQDSHTTFFCVVDQHAITVRQEPKMLYENSLAVAAWYLASGLDPAKCTFFIQSHVPAHAQLGWALNTVTQMGELERMTQFKDKAARHAQNINVGLFDYPVLMAADILLYQTQVVPVGDDQVQHLELTRDVAQRFNGAFGETFTIPKAVLPPAGARIRDLQNPGKKMSKSEPGAGTILLTDSPAEAAKKIKRAVTDSLGVVAYDPQNQPGLANLIEILAACTNRTPQQVAAAFAGQQYGPFKQAVADAVAATLEPLQAEQARILADKSWLLAILKQGAARANEVAEATLARVYKNLGFVPAA
jgi:tryptophanyl-tRNA synthetase